VGYRQPGISPGVAGADSKQPLALVSGFCKARCLADSLPLGYD